MKYCDVCKKRPAIIPANKIDKLFCSKKCTFDYALTKNNSRFSYCVKHNMWNFIIGSTNKEISCRMCEQESVNNDDDEISGYLPGDLHD